MASSCRPRCGGGRAGLRSGATGSGAVALRRCCCSALPSPAATHACQSNSIPFGPAARRTHMCSPCPAASPPLCFSQGDYAVGQVFLPKDPILYDQAKKVIHQVRRWGWGQGCAARPCC